MINDVRRTLVQAKLCREVWWTINGEHRQRLDIVRALNFYVNFFGVIGPAAWVAYITNLSSLFDANPKSIALRRVPGIEDEPGYPALWEKGRVLFRYRSKVIAHRDEKLVNRNFAAESKLTPDSLKWILDTSCQYFDAAASRLNLAPVPPLSCESDFLLLVDDINRRFPRPKSTNAVTGLPDLNRPG